MVLCPVLDSYSVTLASTIPQNIATVIVPYPTTSAGDLLLLSIVRGDPIGVADESPVVPGWTLLTHTWGSNNLLHNTYIRVADGTESGSVRVTHGAFRSSTGVMICLRNMTSTSFDGGALRGATTGSTLTAPSFTPSNAPSLLIFFAGVPLGKRTNNYNNQGMCLLGGAEGGAYQPSNQVYAEVLTSTDPSGSRTWTGAEAGMVSPWRTYAGGLIPWWLAGGRRPVVGFIGWR